MTHTLEGQYSDLRSNRQTLDRGRLLLREVRARLARSPWRAHSHLEPVALAPRLLAVVAAAYELPKASVVSDCQHLQALNFPADEFVARLEHRHAWSSGTAVVYVGALRSALLLGDTGPTPWDDL